MSEPFYGIELTAHEVAPEVHYLALYPNGQVIRQREGNFLINGGRDWSTAVGRAAEQELFEKNISQFGANIGDSTRIKWFRQEKRSEWTEAERVQDAN